MDTLTIGLVGLPSAGKSSIINSLTGKRVAQSGVSRTTLEPKLYETLLSDDNINFNIYDLPGIADIEDNNNTFDTVIFEIIKKCNMVIWVSDIIKSFITNHEMKEFTKIQNYIKTLGINEGIPIQLLIMLSKVDRNLDTIEPTNIKQTINKPEVKSEDKPEDKPEINDDEIVDNEDTTIINIFKNIRDKFKDIDVLLFNAHGRSYFNNKSSNTLKQFIKQYNPIDVNTTFNIKKYNDNIPQYNDDVKIKYFVENYIIKLDFNGKICDTNNVGMPTNLHLYCVKTGEKAIDCKDEKCTDCSNDKYSIICDLHDGYVCLKNSQHKLNRGLLNTTYIDGLPAMSCENGCRITFSLKEQDKILCKHGYNIKKCFDTTQINYNLVSSKYIEVFNSLKLESSKIKFIKFICFDSTNKIALKTNDLLDIPFEKYNADIWNMYCENIRIDIKIFDYLDYYKKLSKNQIYRLIQIGTDLTIYDKLYLYTDENANNIVLNNSHSFKIEIIYNLYYLLTGKCFEIDNYLSYKHNKKYTTEIFNNNLLSEIRNIREKVFGDLENDIDIKMIPIAYEKYGLFWKPKLYKK